MCTIGVKSHGCVGLDGDFRLPHSSLGRREPGRIPAMGASCDAGALRSGTRKLCASANEFQNLRRKRGVNGAFGMVSDHGRVPASMEPGLAAGSIQLVLAKRGFVLPNQSDMSGPDGNGWMGSVIVPVSGETHFNIQIMQK